MALTTITTFTENADNWDPSLLPGLTDGVLANALGGNDTVSGTDFGDEINGQDGDDSLLGNQGNDTLNGGNGNDTIYGGQGDDVISDSSGANFISANQGNDLITITSAGNIVHGGQGDDTIRTTTSDNEIYGDNGNDVIEVNTSGNFVNGNQGVDTINVMADDNEVYGGKGDDIINVESLTSVLINGNNGNDTINVKKGSHTINGGKGNDTIVISGEVGELTVSGDDGSNTIELLAGATTAKLTIFGGQNPVNLPAGQAPVGTANLIISGNNDLSNTTFSAFTTIDIAGGAAAIIPAASLLSAGVTAVTGTGGVTVQGTTAELAQVLGSVTPGSGVTVSAQDTTNNTIAVGLSSTKYGVPAGTSLFVIDGAQFDPLIPDNANAQNNSIAALAIQFGVLPPSLAPQINAGQEITLTLAQFTAVKDFGKELNNVKYIPQVTLNQKDTLLNGFYDLISDNGLTPVENRFLSVIDTKGTPATTDDITTLYFSPTGDFRTTSTNLETISLYNTSGFTPSNLPTLATDLSLDTIAANTQITVV
jgi:hypothetical protein